MFKQQGHFNNMASLAYSPDGQYLVTGGDDGKVSLFPRIVDVKCVKHVFESNLGSYLIIF